MNRSQAGRLGAASRIAQGKTNTAPAQAAFMARFEREVDPEGTLPVAERQKRARAALQAHMIRLSAKAHAS